VLAKVIPEGIMLSTINGKLSSDQAVVITSDSQ
jgi:hypothetical protein